MQGYDSGQANMQGYAQCARKTAEFVYAPELHRARHQLRHQLRSRHQLRLRPRHRLQRIMRHVPHQYIWLQQCRVRGDREQGAREQGAQAREAQAREAQAREAQAREAQAREAQAQEARERGSRERGGREQEAQARLLRLGRRQKQRICRCYKQRYQECVATVLSVRRHPIENYVITKYILNF